MAYELKNSKKFFESECGPWFNASNQKERHWMLSDRENLHRMRCKLVDNDCFNKHEESSRLRDNLHTERTLPTDDQHEKKDTLAEEQDLATIFSEYLMDEREKM